MSVPCKQHDPSAPPRRPHSPPELSSSGNAAHCRHVCSGWVWSRLCERKHFMQDTIGLPTGSSYSTPAKGKNRAWNPRSPRSLQALFEPGVLRRPPLAIATWLPGREALCRREGWILVEDSAAAAAVRRFEDRRFFAGGPWRWRSARRQQGEATCGGRNGGRHSRNTRCAQL